MFTDLLIVGDNSSTWGMQGIYVMYRGVKGI